LLAYDAQVRHKSYDRFYDVCANRAKRGIEAAVSSVVGYVFGTSWEGNFIKTSQKLFARTFLLKNFTELSLLLTELSQNPTATGLSQNLRATELSQNFHATEFSQNLTNT
jgi:hypothetical protein